MRQVLAERRFPLRSIKFLASERSAGKTVAFQGQAYPVERPRPEAFAGVDLVLSSTPALVSREYSPIAARAGAVVVDNSSAWRMDPEVPLVVPEVNADALARIPRGIVANPNCSTIQMVVALKPLHDLARIKRVVVATYQASSGKGATGLVELDAQLAALGRGEPVPAARAHAAQLAGNVLPHDWKAGDEGYSEEEWKMVRETRKIMGDETIAVSATTARVPVRICHSEAINLESIWSFTSRSPWSKRGRRCAGRRAWCYSTMPRRGTCRCRSTWSVGMRCSSAASAATPRCPTA
jgi:aspartate-semialdehyde dehydrogenase